MYRGVPGMQVEIANDLLIFACGRLVQTTSCITADAVLCSCYEWIAAEKGWDLGNVLTENFKFNY